MTSQIFCVIFLKKRKNVLTFCISLCILLSNLKAIHNKDYSVVKTFRAALHSRRRSLYLCVFRKKIANPLTTSIW